MQAERLSAEAGELAGELAATGEHLPPDELLAPPPCVLSLAMVLLMLISVLFVVPLLVLISVLLMTGPAHDHLVRRCPLRCAVADRAHPPDLDGHHDQ